MIKEDYVSLEIAKLLREKGFDWDTYAYYEDENNPNISLRASKAINWNKTEFISKPTHQMAMKWLRKVHNIHIAIVPCEVALGIMDYTYILYKVDTENFIFKNLKIQGRANIDNKMSVPKTCEAALKYVLENLI